MPTLPAASPALLTAAPRVVAVLESCAQALDGYPVQALVDACCEAPTAELRQRAWQLLDAVLGRWIERLEHEVEHVLPSARPGIAGIVQRTRDTRDALRQLQQAVHPLAAPSPA